MIKYFIFAILFITSSNSFARPEAPNKGNTQSGDDCFFNATLEALFHIKPFRDFLENAKKENWYQSNSTPGLVINYIDTMAQNKILNDSVALRKRITSDRNAPNNIKAMSEDQHDAQELFSYILSTFEEQTIFHTQAKKEFDIAFIELINKNKKIALVRDEIWLVTLYKGIDVNESELKKNILKTLAEKQEEYLLKNLYYIILNKSEEENFFKKIDEILEFYKNFKAILNKDIPIWCNNIKELKNKNIKADVIIDLINAMIMIQKKTEGSTDPYNKAKQPTVLEKLEQIDKENRTIVINVFKNDENLFSQFRSLKKEPAIKDAFDWTNLRDTLKEYSWENLIKNLFNITKVQNSLRNIFGLEAEKTINYGFGYGDPIPDLYWLLPLPLEKNYSLLDLLKDFFKEKQQNQNDEFPKEKCLIKKLPEVITIQFKRFGTNLNNKDNRSITFPLTNLDMKPFRKNLNNKDNKSITFPLTNLDMKPYCLEKTNEKKLYDLTAIIEHGGDTGGGHYWAQAKWENEWYCYNDSKVKEMSSEEIEKIANQTIEKGNPYLLVYVRTDYATPSINLKSKEEDTSNEISGGKSSGSDDETPKSEEPKEIRNSLEIVQNLLMALKQKLVTLTEEIMTLQGK